MSEQDDRRAAAIKRITARREFWNHVALYGIVNGLLVVLWAVTGQGYFWPIWPIGGWGIGLAMHAWSVFFHRAISEEEIQREMQRGG